MTGTGALTTLNVNDYDVWCDRETAAVVAIGAMTSLTATASAGNIVLGLWVLPQGDVLAAIDLRPPTVRP